MTNFASKQEIFQNLRAGIAPEVARCRAINGAKRVKTDPVNKKVWKELYPKLFAELHALAAKEAWPPERLLDCLLRLFYCTLVVNLEARNRVVPYDYMDFARRIGEVWEDFCKVCWDAPVNTQLVRLKPPGFANVRQQLLTSFAGLLEAGKPTNQKEVMREYQKAIDLLGNINLTEDEYCSIGQERIVIDFKSGFGSNEKGNTERLLTVAKIYGLLPEKHRCVLVVRAAEGEGNNYLQVLKSSGLWTVCCGTAAYECIEEITDFDLAAWIRKDVAFHADMEKEAYQHLKDENLTKYLAW